MENPRVLIVDDNAKNIQLLANILSQADFLVEYAMNGPSAIEWVRQEKFDAILLDIMMPEMDGFETCQNIKKLDGTADIPIIFLTARDDVETVKKAFNVGGVDYITKPFSQEELLARLTTHIELNKHRKKLNDVNQYLSNEVEKKTKELKDAYQELKILDKAKNEFLGIISHELRTPLNGIIGSLGLLKTMGLNKDIEDILSLLDSSVGRLERYSLYALYISQTQLTNSIVKTFEKIDWKNAIIESSRKFMENNDINIQINDLSNGFNIYTKGNSELIYATFNALFEVSSEYSKDRLCKVTISYDENSAFFKIFDNGSQNEDIVIDNNSLNYTSGNNTTRSKSIELYFANQIALIHEGSLEFCSGSKGTYTTYMLPLYQD